MTVIKNNRILKCLLMMVVSLFLVLGVSIEVSASSDYDRQEADACITISERLSVKGGSDAVSWSNHGYKHFPNKNQSWKDIVKSTKTGPAKYSFDIQDIEAFERAAWESGTPVTNGKNWRVNKFDTTIGAVNGKETVYVRIENSSNTIHGHPISETEYDKLLKEH